MGKQILESRPLSLAVPGATVMHACNDSHRDPCRLALGTRGDSRPRHGRAVSLVWSRLANPRWQTPDDLPDDYRELYEERAAIREYEGGQSREGAEQAALVEVIARMDLEQTRAKRNE